MNDTKKTIRIFISSPGDVGSERAMAHQVVGRLQREFAEHLYSDPKGRWRMDSALAHVALLAYQRGIYDTKKTEGVQNATHI